MPWQSQGGGGPWGGSGGGQGPWGGGNQGGGGGQGTPPPDIEEMLRRSQDKIKRFLPSGGSGKGIALIALVVIAGWLATGLYRVQADEQGVALVFGKVWDKTGPGLHYNVPAPIGEVIKPKVTRVNRVEVGFRGSQGSQNVTRESLMLTGDENIIDVQFVVFWLIKDAANFLFNVRNPELTVKAVAESAMREVIGQTPLEEAITTKRQSVQQDSKELLQKILDQYGAGVSIAEIQLQKADPPQEVIDAFQDVQRAQQDQERSVNEATAYKNDIIPRAKGEAQKMLQDAEAYKQRLIKESEGEAKRFLSVYSTYLGAKDVTTRRLFLERMQDVLQKSEKVIVDKGQGGSGVVPYLPLPELKKRATQ